MKLNDIYTDGKGNNFIINGLELRGNDPWVSYTNLKTQQVYSCRQEAFLSRFVPLPQSR
jgi:hypothetical protein